MSRFRQNAPKQNTIRGLNLPNAFAALAANPSKRPGQTGAEPSELRIFVFVFVRMTFVLPAAIIYRANDKPSGAAMTYRSPFFRLEHVSSAKEQAAGAICNTHRFPSLKFAAHHSPFPFLTPKLKIDRRIQCLCGLAPEDNSVLSRINLTRAGLNSFTTRSECVPPPTPCGLYRNICGITGYYLE